MRSVACDVADPCPALFFARAAAAAAAATGSSDMLTDRPRRHGRDAGPPAGASAEASRPPNTELERSADAAAAASPPATASGALLGSRVLGPAAVLPSSDTSRFSSELVARARRLSSSSPADPAAAGTRNSGMCSSRGQLGSRCQSGPRAMASRTCLGGLRTNSRSSIRSR
jgi:hypothetical protein